MSPLPRLPGLPRLLLGLAAVALVIAAALGAPASQGAQIKPRTTLPIIERQVMCVTCKIPLNVAQSPQADRERVFIQSLIDEGESESQIKRVLVSQYGAAVLGLPSAHGFGLAAYLVPLAAVLALALALAILLPRWRRQARAQAAVAGPPASIGSGDAARLDADLAKFD